VKQYLELKYASNIRCAFGTLLRRMLPLKLPLAQLAQHLLDYCFADAAHSINSHVLECKRVQEWVQHLKEARTLPGAHGLELRFARSVCRALLTLEGMDISAWQRRHLQ